MVKKVTRIRPNIAEPTVGFLTQAPRRNYDPLVAAVEEAKADLAREQADLKRWLHMYDHPEQWPGLKEYTPGALHTIRWWIKFWETRLAGAEKRLAERG